MSPAFFIITCEHGGNRIPATFRPYFSGHESLLQTHRGYDPGALPMARAFSSALSAPLYYSTVSRLLIELNRSPRHAHLYSEITKPLPRPIKSQIALRYYWPYRTEIENRIAQAIERGHHVIHVSSHSFTPELNGQVRNADIGLLYESKRPEEAALCRRWQQALRTHAPELRVRMNYPYSGSSDGLTAALRKRFASDVYMGIELELNQLHARMGGTHWRALRSALIAAFREAAPDGTSPGT